MHRIWRSNRNRGIPSFHLRLGAGLGWAVLLTLVCGLVCGLPGLSQSSGGSSGGQGQGQGQGNMHPLSPRQDLNSISMEETDPVMVERRILALNIQRQKQIVADTDKLLKLARELNEEVAQANTGTLTPDELHKVAEIEKLARSVRQRMTDAAGEVPAMLPLPPPVLYPTH